MILQSFFVYGLFIILLWVFVPSNRDGKTLQPSYFQKRYFNKTFWIATLLFAILMGIRWNVGIDYFSYLRVYNHMDSFDNPGNYNIEEGFVSLIRIFTSIGFHYSIFFFVIGGFQIGSSLCIIKEDGYILKFSCIALLCGGLFMYYCNAVRSGIALGAFLLASSFVLNHFDQKLKSVLIYLGIILISTTIHKSAFIFIPLVFLFLLRLDKIFVPIPLQISLLILGYVMGSLAVWQDLLQYVDVVTSTIGYDKYTGAYIENAGDRELTFGIRRILIMIAQLILILTSKKLRETFKSNTFGFIFILFIIYVPLFPMFINNLTFSRVVCYFMPGYTFMVGYSAYYMLKLRKSRINFLLGITLLSTQILYLLTAILADNGKDCVLYDFFWNHIA